MLTQEQKRIKIAEVCGYQKSPLGGNWYGLGGGDLSEPILAGFHQGSIKPLPDYFNDLNAIAEAENQKLGTLNAKEHGKQMQETTCLHCVGVVPDYQRDLIYLSRLIRSSSAQRAEAFGTTLGLWKAGE